MPPSPFHAADDSDALFADLTEAQARAVRTTEGPVLILAAAGSGKTRVITRRIAYLLSLGVPAWQILALTFTNKAAGEMRERVAGLLAVDERGDRGAGAREGVSSRGLTITTFHALCARLLRRYAPLMAERAPSFPKPDYSIYDADDQLALMKKVIAGLELSTSNFAPRAVLSAISGAKNQLRDAAAYAREAHDFHSKTVAKIFAHYERALRAANAVDFDDLLLLTVRLLRESDEARAEVQRRWQYLMIDEYQDTNHAQFVLGTLLVGAPSGRPPNVCVVGDPDQSIYGWRGADISNILEFEAKYPGATVIPLGENFRSTAPILAAADHLIRHNKRRKHKDLFTKRPGGEKPLVVLCADERHEASVVLDHLRMWHDAPGGPLLRAGSRPTEDQDAARSAGPPRTGYAWKDMAVFYRNNSLSRVIEDELRNAGIPYVIARGTAFYEREEVRDALAYLRVVANPFDDVSLRRIINKPARKIGAASLEAIDAYASAQELPLMEALRESGRAAGVSGAAARAMAAFAAMIEGWRGEGSFMGEERSGSLADLVGRVIRESGLEAHYKAEQLKSESDTDRVGNLEELVSSAAEFQGQYEAASDPAIARASGPGAPPAEGPGADPFSSIVEPPLLSMLRAFLERVSLVADADRVDPSRGAVTLMTLHAAKGLEFACVAMIGLEENLLPGVRAIESEKEMEEERRLCFVGITRAMRHLLLTTAKYRTHRGLCERAMTSRFLAELPADQVKFSDQSGDWADADRAWAGGRGEGEDRRRGAATARLPGAPGRASPLTGASARVPKETSNDPAWPVGSRVRHPQFGVGEVRAVTGLGVNRRATIRFREAGEKTLVLQYARLERLT